MEPPDAIRWTAVNRLITIGAMIAGIGLIAVGLVLGFADAIQALLSLEWQDPDFGAVAEAADPMIAFVFAVVGFVVWQLGKTYALFWTLPRASGRVAARQFDHQQVKSEVLDGLDDRLTKIEEDLEETRRGVQELKRAQHADAFDPGVDLGGPSAPGSDEDDASPESARGASSDAGTATSEVDGAGSTATPVGSDDEDEFTFGETESASDPDTDMTVGDEGITGEPAGTSDEPAGDETVDEDRSTDERTAGSGDDPLA